MARQKVVQHHWQWRGTVCHVGKAGAPLVSAVPWRVARQWLVRRRAEWRRTLGLGLPAQPRAGLLPHFPLTSEQQRRLLCLPLLILPPKTVQIEGFLRGFRPPQVS
jgi:hypothetical protein